jgi:hypothetical protein
MVEFSCGFRRDITENRAINSSVAGAHGACDSSDVRISFS